MNKNLANIGKKGGCLPWGSNRARSFGYFATKYESLIPDPFNSPGLQAMDFRRTLI
jgi:hypothetical protein